MTHFAGRVQSQSTDESDAAMCVQDSRRGDGQPLHTAGAVAKITKFLEGLDLHCTEHGAADMGVQWAWCLA